MRLILTLLTAALASLTSAVPVPDPADLGPPAHELPAHDFTIGPIDGPILYPFPDPTRITTKLPPVRPTLTFSYSPSFYPTVNPTLPTFDPTGSGTFKPTFTVRPPVPVKPTRPPFHTFKTFEPGPMPTIIV